jgi:tetratricopeptide (TPR) repeat protein
VSNPPSAAAAAWLKRGQDFEARATPGALVEAVRCYGEAVALLKALPLREEAVRRQLGLVWMNLGNALQRQEGNSPEAGAVRAYDEAISLLRSLARDMSPDDRNSLGAAWMNRGLSLHRFGRGEKLAEAVESHGEAVAVLRTLPLNEVIWYRLNSAGAHMNLANARLDLGGSDHIALARESARESLEVLEAPDLERTVAPAADVGIKARRVLCDALGLLLASNTTPLSLHELAAEASDAVDEGLALIRHWESRGAPYFRELAERLFRFGTRLYRLHQPQFLAEFILETLDPLRSTGALPATAGFRAIAAEAIAAVRQDLERSPHFSTENSADARRLQIWRDLREAEARLQALH